MHVYFGLYIYVDMCAGERVYIYVCNHIGMLSRILKGFELYQCYILSFYICIHIYVHTYVCTHT